MFRIGCRAALLDDAAVLLAAADRVFAAAVASGAGAAGSIVVGADDLDVGHDAVMLLTM